MNLSSKDIDDAVTHYFERGWARLGRLADEATLCALRERADAIMLGQVRYEGLFFQHDSETGRYEDLEYGKGYQGPSLAYRKVEKLEKDPLFWQWLRRDDFAQVAAKVYGGAAITIYRALLMNKHAGGGSNLPWHQDGGDFWGLDRDPTLQIWTSLDDAPSHGGCIEVVDCSHLRGLVTRLGGVVQPTFLEGADVEPLALPTVAGEVLLIHNHTWHRSARNGTGHPRRAFTVCYMDANTRCRRKKGTPRAFVPVFEARPGHA